jgi:hypothetical protein
MLARASRRECAGQAEQHDLLAFGQRIDLKLVGSDRTCFGRDLVLLAQRAVRQPVADFDRHDIFPSA